MARLRGNNVFGTTTDNPLTNVATTMNSAGLANLPAVVAPDVAMITLDPNRVNGAPEIVQVTAHTASATSATIVRAQEGTAARQHNSGTFWVHAATAVDHRPYSPPSCRVNRTTAQTLTTGVAADITFDAERWDTDAMHSLVTNTNRITINTAGLYLLTGNVYYQQVAGTGDRDTYFLVNNTTRVAEVDTTVGANYFPRHNLTTVYKFAAGDYVTLQCFQNSGGNVNIEVNANVSPEFSATWIGEG